MTDGKQPEGRGAVVVFDGERIRCAPSRVDFPVGGPPRTLRDVHVAFSFTDPSDGSEWRVDQFVRAIRIEEEVGRG